MRIASNVSLVGAIVPWLLIGVFSPQDGVKQWIEDLGHLPESASYADFVGRPAMSELCVLGAQAYPELKSAMTSSNWSIRASSAYLVAAMDLGSEDDTRIGLTQLLQDGHPYVRTVAASICATLPIKYAKDQAKEQLEAQGLTVAGVYQWRPDYKWLSDVDTAKLVEGALRVIDQVKPLAEPPQWWTSSGGKSSTGDASSVSASGMRVLVPPQYISEIGIRSVLTTPKSHLAIEGIFNALLTESGLEQERLGRKFVLAACALGHSCQYEQCPLRNKLAADLLGACEKWMWVVSEPGALGAIVSTLGDLTLWSERAKQLLEGLKDRHPNADVRTLAGIRLTDYAGRLAEATAREEKKRLHAEEVKRKREASRAAKSPVPKPNPPIEVKSPVAEEPGSASRAGRWVFAGAVALVVLLAVWVYFKTRARQEG